ncbi:NAD(P)-binding protein [Thozetella sp. PMI_491]|nr:NAD(P)-binding protein [Thozetella sp. PMI_491]
MSTSKLITLITGANQGVGFEAAKNLLLRSADYHILLGSRDLARGEAAAKTLAALPERKGTVEALQIDVNDDASVDAAAEKVSKTYGRVDILVNNAGIANMGPPGRDAARDIFATNVVGYISVSEAFLLLMRQSAAAGHTPRLVFVSSSTGSLTLASDPTHALHRVGAMEYRAANAARNMIMHQYYLRLKGDGFKVLAADPGLNASNLTKDPESLRARGAAEPIVGGERIAAAARGDRDAGVGKVCGEYGGVLSVCPW